MINSGLKKKSIFLLTEYYKKNMAPFLDALDSNVLWFGPRSEQIIYTRETMTERFSVPVEQEFRLGDITVYDVRTGTSAWEILMEFMVATIFPTGEKHLHHQRIQFSWGLDKSQQTKDKKSPYVIKMIHISNCQHMEHDCVSASVPEDSLIDAVRVHVPDFPVQRCILHGKNGVTHFTDLSEIEFIESVNGGKSTVIHTTESEFQARERLQDIQKAYPERFLRPHISYLVNPMYAESLERFQLTLQSGAVLPVPEKRFTAFKQELTDWITKML